MNPLVELRTLVALRRFYRDLRPDIIQHLTIKPVLYGGALSRWIGTKTRIQSIMGLGFLFNSPDLLTRALRKVLAPAFRYALGGPGSILTLQNPDDCERLRATSSLGKGDWPRIEIVPGSGVDSGEYNPEAKPDEPPIVLFAGRLIKSKGIVEFAEAARLVRAKYPVSRFVVCGNLVSDHPAAVSESDMRAWVEEGVIEWWGHRDDMPSVLGSASVVVLPSHHGEGLPRALLEAAATARPIVTTDSEGCREIGRDGINAVIFPVCNSKALAEAILRLLNDPELRVRLGREGRRIVMEEFSLEVVIHKTLYLYDQMLRSDGIGQGRY